jgi:hypothetical protein
VVVAVGDLEQPDDARRDPADLRGEATSTVAPVDGATGASTSTSIPPSEMSTARP